MDKKFKELIDELSKVFKEKYPDFKGIYFYGSRARGNFDEDSDYDVVYVFDREIDWRFEYEVKDIIYDYELKYEFFLDNRIYSYKNIQEPSSPFRTNVKSEGIFYGV
ncbi:MAG: nucleotidyltransferase domain-containing protein [Ignavibacteria bacterium]|nr:nucleotidyltransferase domain-containing protein [Ignavibacteria bacterium]